MFCIDATWSRRGKPPVSIFRYVGVSLKVGTHVPCEHIPGDHNLDLYHSDKLEHPDVILMPR